MYIIIVTIIVIIVRRHVARACVTFRFPPPSARDPADRITRAKRAASRELHTHTHTHNDRRRRRRRP